jgi:hypothetical protein
MDSASVHFLEWSRQKKSLRMSTHKPAASTFPHVWHPVAACTGLCAETVDPDEAKNILADSYELAAATFSPPK